MRSTEHLLLPAAAAGTSRALHVWRWGDPNARPKAYVQASVHADEIPGMLVASHLAGHLDDAAAAGRVLGEIVMVPVANPVGLAQRVGGTLHGRFELNSRTNFNRGFASLTDAAAERVAGRLGPDAARNVETVRDALVECAGAVAARAPASYDETQGLRAALMRLAVDADVVLDLHCDTESELHLFLGTPLWPGARDLARELESRFNFLAEDSGGSSFDEAVAGPWWALARRFGDVPLPPACLAATVELRGQADVSDAQAAVDAAAIARFFAGRGILAAPAERLQRSTWEPQAVPLEAVDIVAAPAPGILLFRVGIGEAVERGDVVAEIVDPLEPGAAAARRVLRAGTRGVVFTRCRDRYVGSGQTVMKIAGDEPLEYRRAGALLED